MRIESFNYTYFLLLAFLAGLTVLFSLYMRKKPMELKKKVILGISSFNLFLFILYKISLYAGHPDLEKFNYEFNIWTELPLHLCNITLFLIPIGIFLNNDKIYAYGFYISPLAAFFALTFPNPYFLDTNFFYFHTFGYYITHGLIIVIGVLLVTFGIFRPNYKSALFLNIFVIILSFGIFCLNLLLRHLTGSPVNYFYTYEPEGISILELFWSWVPIPYVYAFFAIIILNVFIAVITFPFFIKDHKKMIKE